MPVVIVERGLKSDNRVVGGESTEGMMSSERERSRPKGGGCVMLREAPCPMLVVCAAASLEGEVVERVSKEGGRKSCKPGSSISSSGWRCAWDRLQALRGCSITKDGGVPCGAGSGGSD